MSIYLYNIGDVAKVTALTKDAGGSLRDPATLTFQLVEPDGSEVEYSYPADPEVVRVSAGSFYVLVPITKFGSDPYRYRWTSVGGTTPVPASVEGSLPVRKQSF